MARWSPGLHPRDRNGKFKGSGAGAGAGRVKLIGKGNTLRYSRAPTRAEIGKTVLTQAAAGALIGGSTGGLPGAAVGSALVAASTAAKIAVLTRRTKKAGGALRR